MLFGSNALYIPESGDKMSKWFFLNGVVLVFALYHIVVGYNGFHMVLGGLGVLFILYNWTRHAMFATIRSNISRERKIKFARISKKALPFHKWTGTSALIIVLFHAMLVYKRYGFHLNFPKMTSGLLASGILTCVVLTGWQRWYRTTVNRRFVHWTLGFILFGCVVLHVFL
jgi:hypothetical protein